jgi:hypothetical protein
MKLTEQELFDTEDLIRTVHKYELLDDRDGGIEAVTKFRKATEAKVREEYAGLVELLKRAYVWLPDNFGNVHLELLRNDIHAALGKVSQ